ncbi:ABC transporter substrate-binding protein [Dactylosporangium sp. CA-092794]|uniref:ABC transporter substrate-binding protein n=1 Tax=Dactylosporangium sp. CA-092794 TaxID=3239929 RepID=UPI003D90D10E
MLHDVDPVRLSRRRFTAGLVGAAGAALLGGVAACDSGDKPAAASKDQPIEKVTYLTGFGTFGRESYAWVAQAKGFFRDAGLEVTIQAGAAGDANHEALTSGKAQFAAVDASGAFTRYARGDDTSFQIVAAIQQQTLLSIITLDGKLNTPKSLEGRTIGVATGAAPKTIFPAYARLAGIDQSKVNWVNSTPQALNSLLVGGKIDGAGLFVVGVPAVEKAAGGRKATVLPYSTYLNDLFGTVLVTPKALIEKQPDQVRRFTGALMQGLLYAVDHPEEAGDILHKSEPTQDPAVAAAELKLMRPYVLPTKGATIGVLEPSRVARTIALLQSAGLFTAPLTAEQIVRGDLLGTAPAAA